jgi:hypothetical protein
MRTVRDVYGRDVGVSSLHRFSARAGKGYSWAICRRAARPLLLAAAQFAVDQIGSAGARSDAAAFHLLCRCSKTDWV